MLTIKDINDYFYEINEGLKHAGKKGEIWYYVKKKYKLNREIFKQLISIS